MTSGLVDYCCNAGWSRAGQSAELGSVEQGWARKCGAGLDWEMWSRTGLGIGLQRYIKLSSFRDMGSGKPAYHIASPISARFANFLESVIVLKINKFPDKIYLCFKQIAQRATIAHLSDPICPKTLCSLSPTPMLLYTKFDQD